MPKLYQIKNWESIYENSKSKTIKNPSWCPIPNKQDGLGLGLIMLEEDGAAIYGAFVSVVLMCSKQSMPRQGYLSDTGLSSGRPLTPKELSVKTKVSHVVIERMLHVTCSEQVDWITSDTEVTPECHYERPEQNRTEQKGTEQQQHPELNKSSTQKDLFVAYKIDKKLVWSWLLLSCDQLNENNFPYETILKLEDCFPNAPSWFAGHRIVSAMTTAIIDSPRRTAGYVRSIWAEIDLQEGKKVRS